MEPMPSQSCALCAAASAAGHWGVFDVFSFIGDWQMLKLLKHELHILTSLQVFTILLKLSSKQVAHAESLIKLIVEWQAVVGLLTLLLAEY